LEKWIYKASQLSHKLVASCGSRALTPSQLDRNHVPIASMSSMDRDECAVFSHRSWLMTGAQLQKGDVIDEGFDSVNAAGVSSVPRSEND
jgi:hypothetical protein